MSMLDQATARGIVGRINGDIIHPGKVSVQGTLNVYYINPKLKELLMPDLNAALKELLTRIRNGEEYPDAAWETCRKHRGVAWQDLQKAYDAHCALPREQMAAREAELEIN